MIPDAEVMEAVHENEKKEGTVRGWHRYPPKQLDAALKLAALLVSHYGLRDVIGHDDVAPLRKQDPGPAFPMASFRARALGEKP